MAGAIVPMQEIGVPRRRRASGDSAHKSTEGPGWLPIALGAAAIAAGVAAVRSTRRDREGPHGQEQGGEPEAERSITIGKSAEELYRRWRDPQTLTRVMADFATVRTSGGGRFHWKVEGPLGRTYEWDSETVGDRPGTSVGWRSQPGADLPNEGSVRFRPATGDRGTVATLRFRFDPPGGLAGKLVGAKSLGLAADKALRRFKSLVETGEIPTTERQPAARADTR